MASAAKLAANRQNAVKSTGPKTAEGKARSSINAITHGLTARHFVADGESLADFEILAQNVFTEFPPRNEIEQEKVQRLIHLLWKLRRARLLETAVLSTSHHREFNILDEYDTDLPLPKRYKRALEVDIFEFAEKVDGYTARMWREINTIVDELRSNRVLQDEIVIDGQSEEIASERMTAPS
jgi:hypothetical protein